VAVTVPDVKEREVMILTLNCVPENEDYQFASLDDLTNKGLSVELSRYNVAWSGKTSLTVSEISLKGKDKNTSLTGAVVRVGDLIVDGSSYYYNDLYKVIDVSDKVVVSTESNVTLEESEDYISDCDLAEDISSEISFDEVKMLFEEPENEPEEITVSESVGDCVFQEDIVTEVVDGDMNDSSEEPEETDLYDEEEELSYDELLAEDENISEEEKPVEENIVTLSFDDFDFFASGSAT